MDAGVPASECDPLSVRWLAPELLFPKEFGLRSARRTKETDTYAFAMVMFEVGPSSFLQSSNRTRPRATPSRLRNSCPTTGLLWIIPLPRSSERNRNPASKVWRSSTPAGEWFGSRTHGRTMGYHEALLEAQKSSLWGFARRLDPESSPSLRRPQWQHEGGVLNPIMAPPTHGTGPHRYPRQIQRGFGHLIRAPSKWMPDIRLLRFYIGGHRLVT